MLMDGRFRYTPTSGLGTSRNPRLKGLESVSFDWHFDVLHSAKRRFGDASPWIASLTSCSALMASISAAFLRACSPAASYAAMSRIN